MKPRFTADDAKFMRLALRLAARGRGDVEPNPMVGAVLVRRGRIVGRGYHRRFGAAHAEVEALHAAGTRARGATLYVTLEPCCHWGKQPPCTDAVRASGVQRVVAAMIDPFPGVRGKGVSLLRKGGIRVDVGLLADDATRLNGPFLKRLAGRGPWVIAKWAQSLDGCVATARGESRWISAEASRRQVQVLRGRMDGIIVGIGTVLADDPLLMARPDRAKDIHRVATRIVLDSQCRLPVGSQLVRTISFAPVIVVHARKLGPAGERRRSRLAERGVLTVSLPADPDGRPAVGALLRYLGKLDYANVLVEGGPEVMAAFLRGGHVDEAHVYIAPKVLGGAGARHAIAGGELGRLKDATELRLRHIAQVGPDLHLTLTRA